MESDLGQSIPALIMVLVLGLGYFLPWLIALGRGHHQTAAIFVLNLTLGWTALGWLGALIWAFTAVRRPPD